MSNKSLSSSPFPIAPAPPTPSCSFSTEQVWPDICHPSAAGAVSASNGIFFQEFLQNSLSSNSHHQHRASRHSCFEVASRRSFDQFRQQGRENDPPETGETTLRLNPLGPGEYSWTSKAPDSPLATTVEFSAVPKKRVILSDDTDDEKVRKSQRLIKNRESAAKSRARKFAYTNELEEKLKGLKAENAKLKKSCMARSAELPRKHKLARTLTAPF